MPTRESKLHDMSLPSVYYTFTLSFKSPEINQKTISFLGPLHYSINLSCFFVISFFNKTLPNKLNGFDCRISILMITFHPHHPEFQNP